MEILEFAPVSTTKYEARATEALRGLKHRNKLKLGDVAKLSEIPESSMSRVYNGRQPVTLKMLGAIEYLTGESAVEMLVDPHVEMKAVSPNEAAVLRYFRSWPKATRDAFLTFASYFADEPPETSDARRAHEQLRRLPDGKKRTAYAYLTTITEGFLPGEDLTPDIRKALGLPEIIEPQSPRTAPARKRRSTPKRST